MLYNGHKVKSTLKDVGGFRTPRDARYHQCSKERSWLRSKNAILTVKKLNDRLGGGKYVYLISFIKETHLGNVAQRHVMVTSTRGSIYCKAKGNSSTKVYDFNVANIFK
jgi:hypothetical protein